MLNVPKWRVEGVEGLLVKNESPGSILFLPKCMEGCLGCTEKPLNRPNSFRRAQMEKINLSCAAWRGLSPDVLKPRDLWPRD